MLLLVAALAVACASEIPQQSGALAHSSIDRKIVKSAELTVTVSAPDEGRGDVERIVGEAGGFVDHSTATRDSSILLRCRVPAAKLEQVMVAVAALGDEDRRSVTSSEVTEQYTDLETRLRNSIALRERLQQLLKRATKVEDVLAIEKELNRIQSEIETAQAAFDRLKSEIELSTLSVTLRRKQILGPLGYVGYGLWWVVSKLFVIR